MSQDFHVPADARARGKMLAAHLEESTGKASKKSLPRRPVTHMKVPPTHGKHGNRSQSG